MPKETRKIAAIAVAFAVAVSPATGSAQMNDGRIGPETMTGGALNAALGDFNAYLQARYAQDDLFANLDSAPAQDFVTTAVASATTPFDRSTPDTGAFGPLVGDGSSLMIHLVSFNEERSQRGDDLFIRIARAEAGRVPSMETVARDVFAGTGLGDIRDDPTLDAEMAALSAGLKGFEDRAAKLGQAVPAVTAESFDNYGKALMLLY